MTREKLQHCSFCGLSKDEVKKLIVGDTVAICSECVQACNDLMAEEAAELQKAIDGYSSEFDAYSIKEYLDQYIIGQDAAKAVLAVALSNHYKRINNPSPGGETIKGNLLLLGPSGTGKTSMVRHVAKYINVPFVTADATSITQAGYIGSDVESMISSLLQETNNDVKQAERGIIFLDEIDKIARKGEDASATRDVSGEGVQQALLKMIEGTTVQVAPTGQRRSIHSEMIEVNTKDILFIAGGAFIGLEKIIEKRTHGSSMGFGSNNYTEHSLKDVTPDDLMRYGLIPELIGRFTTIVTLEELTKDQMIQILTNAKHNFLEHYTYIFKIDGLNLSFTKDAIEQIAENCIQLKTGARGLNTELARVLMPHMFHIRKYKENGWTELTINRALVISPKALV